MSIKPGTVRYSKEPQKPLRRQSLNLFLDGIVPTIKLASSALLVHLAAKEKQREDQ